GGVAVANNFRTRARYFLGQLVLLCLQVGCDNWDDGCNVVYGCIPYRWSLHGYFARLHAGVTGLEDTVARGARQTIVPKKNAAATQYRKSSTASKTLNCCVVQN
ncbi:MAG: hypothetical protein ACRDHZ_18330, partial [Ktedonobacteraceae bacterium]